MKAALSKLLSPLSSYALATTLIVGWWLIAFHQQHTSYPVSYSNGEPPAAAPIPFEDHGLFLIDRKQLHRALSGDFSLMGQLIAEWDVDAQLLHSISQRPAKRLPATDYLRSQWLSRWLKNNAENKTALARTPSKKLLPQTYVSASFLLALSHPKEIVALPHSLREHTQLYPRDLTDQIPLDIDRHNSEKLFLARPEIAFVANYSNPAAIQTLQNQGIALYMMKDLNTLSDITNELIHIGNRANRPLEAEMLKIFIEAAMAANDNKISMLTKYYADNQISSPRILYLNFHQKFSVPTPHTMTGQLLKRLGKLDITLTACPTDNLKKVGTTIDKERLLNLNPDCLIIAAENSNALQKEMHRDAAFSELKALRQNRLYFVDEAIQQSPTQYIVLAYHDLIQALITHP